LKYNSVTGVATELYFISFASKIKMFCLESKFRIRKIPLSHIVRYYKFALSLKEQTKMSFGDN
jgi:hypothetical protein